MGRTVFEREVRPYLTVIPVGRDGIAFDRLDLDAWIEQHKVRSGRPPTKGARSWADPPAPEASSSMPKAARPLTSNTRGRGSTLASGGSRRTTQRPGSGDNSTTPNASNSPVSVEAGKYVAPGVYVGARQGAAGNSSRGVVEIQVLDHTKIEGDIGADSNGRVGVKMEWDY